MAEGIVSFHNLTKQQLLERCRELEFIDDVQDLKCTRCNRLALEHWYTNCGHALCPNCKRLLSVGRCRCPHCGQFIQHIEEQSADFEEKLNSLQVKCPNNKYGCPLQTTVKLIMEHLVACEWTKEHALPAVYRGAHTVQMLLEEVNKLKTQIGDMNGTIDFLLKELHRRQEVEDDIKKNAEISVADIKSCLNGLSSDLHFETNTLKAQIENINLEELQTHFSNKAEVKQQKQQLTNLDGKTNVMFQILDDKLDKFSQRLTKEIENINAKIKAGEDKLEVMQNEDKISMNNFQKKQEATIENHRQELLANSKDLQSKVEKFNDDFKMDLHKVNSDVTLELEQQEANFNQKLSLEVKQLEENILKIKLQFDEECKKNGVKIEALINNMKKQEKVLMKQIHDKIKEELKQIEEKLDSANANSNKLLIQMLEVREDRFSQKLTKEVKAIDNKIVTIESKTAAAVTKNRQETTTISKNLQGQVEKSSKELKAQLQKLSSELNQILEQKETSFNQKLSNEVKQLDEKINKNKTTVEMNAEGTEEKMEAMKCETMKQEVEIKKQIATNVENLQTKFQVSIKELKQQLVKVKSHVTQGLKQEQLLHSQKLTEEIKAIEEKMRIQEKEIDKKMNIGFEKQEVAVGNCRKEMAAFSEEIKSKINLGQQEVEIQVKRSIEKSTEEFNTQFKQFSSQVHDKTTEMSHIIENKTKQLKEEIDELNKKANGIEKNIDGTFSTILVDYTTKVQTIQQWNPQLNAIEAFQRGVAIEQLLNRKLSMQQLVDSFLFGTAQEKMVFESLCLKWTIKNNDLLIPKEGSHELVSDVFPVYGFQYKAQLKLTINSDGRVHLYLCFKVEERKGQNVDIKLLPMLTFIIKDLNRHNRNIIRYRCQSFNLSNQYNEFVSGSGLISKSQWHALISPQDKSMEVLVLVEPLTIINKPLSVDGTIKDTIEHYSRKLEMAKEWLVYGHASPVLLTHAGGYRVAVEMHLNWPIGENKRGLQAWIWFLSCEFDSQLKWEFNHELSITLINQLDAKKNITIKRQAKEANYYYMAIASENEIGSGGFLVNDTLTYHVTIKPIQ